MVRYSAAKAAARSVRLVKSGGLCFQPSVSPVVAWVACCHVKQRWVPGSAAHRIAHALVHKGLSPAVEPLSFRVEGMTGPLLEGELDRAREWGEALGERLTEVTAPSPPSTR